MAAAVAGWTLLAAPPAAADVKMTLLRIENDNELSDRINAHAPDEEHVINLADCLRYTEDLTYITLVWSGSPENPSGGIDRDVVKISEPDADCQADKAELGTDEKCSLRQANTSLPLSGEETRLLASDITRDCAAGSDFNVNVYIILDEPDSTPAGSTTTDTNVSSLKVSFRVDLEPPKPVQVDEIEPGDANLKVSWSDRDNEGESDPSYRVYWSTRDFDDSTKGEDDVSSDTSGSLSYQITGLDNYRKYYVAVAALDANDNESVIGEKAKMSGSPVEVADFFELYKQAGGDEQGGFCFVATAAWGSPMAADVVTLRSFRDRYLMTWAPGRLFVDAYYTVSPPLADLIADHEGLRTAVRVALWPFVAVAGVTVELPTVLGTAILLGCALAWGLGVSLVAVRVQRRAARRGGHA